MRNHTWMHAGILGAILAVFGLGALGVAVPTAVIYLILLACPLMMVFMMFGMNHGEATAEGSGEPEAAGVSATAQQVYPLDAAASTPDPRPGTTTDARSV